MNIIRSIIPILLSIIDMVINVFGKYKSEQCGT